MDFKFSKGGEEEPLAEPASEKKNQTAILVLLLILVGGFSYVYFFTGIIKPLEAPKPAVTAAAPQMVKMPMPPREETADKGGAKPSDASKGGAAPAKAEPPKAPAPVAAPAKAEPPKAPVPTAAPTKAEPPKPSAAPAAATKAEPAKSPAPPAAKPPAPAAAKPKEEPKKAEPPKIAEKKPAAADKKQEPAKTAAKPAPAATAAKQKEQPPKKSVGAKKAPVPPAEPATWSVLVGTYVLESALSADMGRVRKAGLAPDVKAGPRKITAMNRLFLSDFTDRSEAIAALAKLKRHTSDAFIVDQAGKHSVYAGSYLIDVRAASEVERLKNAGFSITLKSAEISIPSQSLTLGPFIDRKSADSALEKLQAAGIKAAITRP